MKQPEATEPCPCGGKRFGDCCGRFLDPSREWLPASAEELMRSRYSAYALRDEGWLQRTWHSSTRPQGAVTEDGLTWLGLEVRRSVEPALGDATGLAVVEFVARYRADGRGHRLHEISRFKREDGEWRYLDGSFPEKKK
jgi:SEC-C motif-containing protein